MARRAARDSSLSTQREDAPHLLRDLFPRQAHSAPRSSSMPSNKLTDASSPFTLHLSPQAALSFLVGLGGTLASIVLFDVYQDWIPRGNPF